MTPHRGEIWHAELEPIAGREQAGARFCLVVTDRAFNAKMKLAWICPITTGGASVRGDMTVSLQGLGLNTSGVVLVHQLRAVDLSARKGKKTKDVVPDNVLNLVLDRLAAIIEGN